MARKSPQSKTTKKTQKSDPLSDDTLTMPTLEEWMATFQDFRDELQRQYQEGKKWDTDTAFCRETGLSRAQFARVMQGTERPSFTIMAKLKEVFPNVYTACETHWLANRDTDDVRELAANMRNQMRSSYPGTTYILTTRPLERDSDRLIRVAAEFLEAHDENRLAFVVGNFDEEWKHRYPPSEVPTWLAPIVDTENIGRYIESILDRLSDRTREQQRMQQISCTRFSYLDIADAPDGDSPDSVQRLNKLSAHLLCPFTIIMLYRGSREELVGYIYFRCGDHFRWFPLPEDSEARVRDYIITLLDLQNEFPEIIKDWPISDLSIRLKQTEGQAK